MFSIKFNDAKLNISLKQDLTKKPAATKEFIRSDSEIKVKVDVSMPVWLKAESIIAYNDTLEDVNLDDILKDDNFNELVLRFANTNALPFGFNINVILLDENFNVIPNQNTYAYHVDAATIDADGDVLSEVKSNFYIKYKKGENEDLKQTKHIVLAISTNELTNKVMVKDTNSIKIKLGAYTSGGISISSND